MIGEESERLERLRHRTIFDLRELLSMRLVRRQKLKKLNAPKEIISIEDCLVSEAERVLSEKLEHNQE